jgi:hypothetical protein
MKEQVMSVKTDSRPAVFSSDIFKIPLENGQHIEIEVDIMWSSVEVQPPRPKPKARLVSFATHDLGFGQTAVIQVDWHDGGTPTY